MDGSASLWVVRFKLDISPFLGDNLRPACVGVCLEIGNEHIVGDAEFGDGWEIRSVDLDIEHAHPDAFRPDRFGEFDDRFELGFGGGPHTDDHLALEDLLWCVGQQVDAFDLLELILIDRLGECDR